MEPAHRELCQVHEQGRVHFKVAQCVDCLILQFLSVLTSRRFAEDAEKGGLSPLLIRARRFAQGVCIPSPVQTVIDDLIGKTQWLGIAL